MTTDPGTPPALNAPIALPPNRVSRSYRGGALLDRFRAGGVPGLAGDAGADAATDGDGLRPEDWIASTIRAWTPAGKALSDEGLSVVNVGDEELTLRELVQRRAPAAVGGRALVRAAGPTTGLLVAVRDTAQRLPVHCHPTRAFAERFLGSRWGKTEAWLILGTRQIAGEEPPSIHLGFREDVERAVLRRWIDDQDIAGLLGAMHHLTVAPGDAWLVPAGMPHTVGAGVFLVGLQEPTDFSIVAETAGFPNPAEDAHLGMGWDVMVDAFDRKGVSARELETLRQVPALVEGQGAVGVAGRRERLLGTDAEPYFRAERVRLGEPGSTMRLPWSDTFLVGIVCSGSGRLIATGGSLSVRAGDSFALPAAASTDATIECDETLEMIFCLPPEPDALATTGWQSRSVMASTPSEATSPS